MLREQMPKKRRQPPVKIFSCGREVCAKTYTGWLEYITRRIAMEVRQGGRCALADANCAGALCFDHESGRGLSAAIRDDRIEILGLWHNAALCYFHNSFKGSKRYKWVNGSYLPVTKFQGGCIVELFEKRRVMVHINGGKLRLDKSDVRRWQLNLQFSLAPEDVHSCHEAIVSNYQQIEARQNGVDEIAMNLGVSEQIIEFFGLADHSAPTVRLGKCIISDMKMKHDTGLTILELKAEAECTGKLHDFVKDYAFTTVWVELEPVQRTLVMQPAPEPKQATLPKTAVN